MHGGGGAEWEAVELRQKLRAEGEVGGGGGVDWGRRYGAMGEAVELWEKL